MSENVMKGNEYSRRANKIPNTDLVIDAAQSLGDGGGVGHHADGALDAGQVAAGDDGGGLVVDAALEAGGAPVDELDGPLGLDGGNGGGKSIHARNLLQE